jgi:hypothetical protein
MHRAPRRGRVVVARDAASKRTPRSGAKGFRLRANVRAWFVPARARRRVRVRRRDARVGCTEWVSCVHPCARARDGVVARDAATREDAMSGARG